MTRAWPRLLAILAIACAGTACGSGNESPDPASDDGGGAGDDGSGGVGDTGGDGSDTGGDDGAGDDGGGGTAPEGLVFSGYKDTSINMNWNTNVISTLVPGSMTPLATDMTAASARAITLSFATGECGAENWGGLPGDAMASANVPLLSDAGIDYILSTGGAAGSFTCGSDDGFTVFLDRWALPHLIGVDFDIEAGQSEADIANLIARIEPAHAAHPELRFSLTVATLGNTDGAESFNAKGVEVIEAALDAFGTLPSYVTVNLMTMDYGSPSPSVCVVNDGGDRCDMGQSAIQAAQNLQAGWAVPLANVELTPMIGGNDVQSNVFSLDDADTIASFAIENALAGVHYWSYDRDLDCAPGPASPTCNSLGDAGPHGFLQRFRDAGLE